MLEFIRKITDLFFKKQVVVFLFFIILSTIFWLMHSVSTQKSIVVDYCINYRNIPDNIKINNDLPQKVYVTISDEKFSLSDYFFTSKSDEIIIDLDSINKIINAGRKTLPLLEFVEPIVKKDFGARTNIIKFSPDIINIEYITLDKKSVPVIFNSKVDVRQHYIISDSIILEPKEVNIYGSKEYIDKISEIKINNIDAYDITHDTILEHTFVRDNNISYSPKTVKIKVPVEKSTLKALTIPVTILNAPNNTTMKAFPSHITVEFLVPLSKFHLPHEKEFILAIDYNKKLSNNTCSIEIVSQPKYISIMSLTPKLIEFSLEEKTINEE